MAGEGQGQGRTWRGRNADERREIRRRQLIDAGIDGLITDDPAYMHGLIDVLSNPKAERKPK